MSGASNSIGGAIAISGVSDHVSITASSFSHNVAGWYGAALYSQDGTNVLVEACSFLNNTLTHPTTSEALSQGAAISVWGATKQLTVRSCTFRANVASAATAIWLRTGSEFQSAIFSGNRGYGNRGHTLVGWDGHGANPNHTNMVADGQLTAVQAQTGVGDRWLYVSIVPQDAVGCALLKLPPHAAPASVGHLGCSAVGVADNHSCAVHCSTVLMGGGGTLPAAALARAFCLRGKLLWNATCADALCGSNGTAWAAKSAGGHDDNSPSDASGSFCHNSGVCALLNESSDGDFMNGSRDTGKGRAFCQCRPGFVGAKCGTPLCLHRGK